MKKLEKEFFERDVLLVAPDLLGKIICRYDENGILVRGRITETEAYRGEEDTACHAHKGRTPRTDILYGESGEIYVYLCYGMHWLMNVVTGEAGVPQAVLIRAGESYPDGTPFNGPAKFTKYLGVTKAENYQPIYNNDNIWIESDEKYYNYKTDTRVGINYATEEYRFKEWRFILDKEKVEHQIR